MDNTVHTDEGKIVEFSPIESTIATLRQQYGNKVYDLTKHQGLEDAKADRRAVKKYRTSLENKRVELKAPLLQKSRLLDTEAKRITAALLEIERPIDELIKAEEKRKAEIKAKKEAEEREKLAAIRDKINGMIRLPYSVTGMSSTEISGVLTELTMEALDPNFYGQFFNEACKVKDEAVESLNDKYTGAKEREDEEKAKEEARVIRENRNKAEAERLEAQRMDQEAKQKKLDDQEAVIVKEKAELEKKASPAPAKKKAKKANAEPAGTDREALELIAELCLQCVEGQYANTILEIEKIILRQLDGE